MHIDIQFTTETDIDFQRVKQMFQYKQHPLFMCYRDKQCYLLVTMSMLTRDKQMLVLVFLDPLMFIIILHALITMANFVVAWE